MSQRTVNTVCLLLAVAGLSFGIGQSVGQDRAEAGSVSSQLRKVQRDVDSVEAELTKGERSYGGLTSKTVRGYVVQTCRNTATISC